MSYGGSIESVMGEIMDERQNKAISWISDLQKYARKKNMPMRILDELEECTEQLASSEIDWEAMNITVTELLESIEEKAYPGVIQNEQRENEILMEDVEAQVKNMAKRCHTENITSLESMEERKNLVIKKSCGQLMEISHTKAHLEELKNEDLYLHFFQTCKSVYEKDVSEMIHEMLQSISGNYSHMLNHMKSMFKSIGGYRYGLGNEKFYYEYEERKNGIDKKIQGEAENSDIGGADIISLGEKTKKTIKGIVSKLVWKRKILAWLPFIILLGAFTGNAISNQAQSQAIIESAVTSSDNDNSQMTEAAIKLGTAVIKKVSLKAVKSIFSSVATFLSALMISLGAAIIFIILLIILLYMLYLKVLKSWCNNKICKKCGEFLKTELEQFAQNNELAVKLDNVMKNAAAGYEQQYMLVLENIFQGKTYENNKEEDNEKVEISFLHDEWKKIIYD